MHLPSTSPSATGARNVPARVLALAEVTLLLAAAHVACRAFKHFTVWGRAEVAAHLNFSPGWTMALFAGVWLLVRGEPLADYGLAIGRWPGELRRAVERAAETTRVPTVWWWIGASAMLVVSVWAGLRDRSGHELAWLMTWQLCATAVGEEMFFRGYAQTRLSRVFPPRFSWRGGQFGWGLVATALLFGLLHAFNTVDYFGGRFAFAWTLAASTAVTGCLFGLLREVTGSVAPGVLVHFLNNLLWFTVLPSVASRLTGRG